MATYLLAPFLVLLLVWQGSLEPVPVHAAQSDSLDCTAFASIDEANDYYLENPDAESAIDDDGDGIACEVFFGLEERNSGDEDAGSDVVAELSQTVDDNLDCEDFDYREEAQDILDTDPDDPNNLDPNEDGLACALLPSNAELDSGTDGDVELAQSAEDERAQREADREARRAERQAGQDDDAQGEDVLELTCADFTSQEEAQVAFEEDPEGMAALDEDGNLIACEELVAEETTEPTQEDSREERRNRRNTDQQAEETPDTVIDEPRRNTVREDLDCIDFQFQEEAQAIFDQDPSDPFNLDPNGDGFACSSLPLATPQVLQVPRTGIGTTLPLSTGALIASSMLAGLAACAASRRRSSN